MSAATAIKFKAVLIFTGHKSQALAAHYSAGDSAKLNKEVTKGFDSLGLAA